MGAQGRGLGQGTHREAQRPPRALPLRPPKSALSGGEGPSPLTCQGITPRHDGVGDPSSHDALGEGESEGLPYEAPDGSSWPQTGGGGGARLMRSPHPSIPGDQRQYHLTGWGGGREPGAMVQ